MVTRSRGGGTGLLSGWLEDRRREKALNELLALTGRQYGLAAPTGAMPTPAVTGAVQVQPDGAVTDAGGWFRSQPDDTWVHDSESFFRRLPNPLAPRVTEPAARAPALVRPPAASAPAPGPAATAPAPTTAPQAPPAWGMGDEIRKAMLLQDLGLDPMLADRIAALQAAQKGLASDPYGLAAVGLGKAPTAPYTFGNWGSGNRVTGAVTPSDLSVAQTDTALARGEEVRSRIPANEALATQRVTAATRNLSAAEKASVQVLADGTLVMRRTGPDGSVVVEPVTDTQGQSVRGQTATQAQVWQRSKSPRDFRLERFKHYTTPRGAGGAGMKPDAAEEAATADVERMFGPGALDAEPGPAAVPRPPGQAQARPGTEETAEARLRRQAADAVKARPDLADKIMQRLNGELAKLRGGS